jgi:ferritin-like metal-binding protein YciE
LTAEKQLVKALPKMAKGASIAALKEAIEDVRYRPIGNARTLAELLGQKNAPKFLQETLDEEKEPTRSSRNLQ